MQISRFFFFQILSFLLVLSNFPKFITKIGIILRRKEEREGPREFVPRAEFERVFGTPRHQLVLHEAVSIFSTAPFLLRDPLAHGPANRRF